MEKRRKSKKSFTQKFSAKKHLKRSKRMQKKHSLHLWKVTTSA